MHAVTAIIALICARGHFSLIDRPHFAAYFYLARYEEHQLAHFTKSDAFGFRPE